METSSAPAAAKSFFAALYDLSFQSFVTPKIIQIIYVIALAIIGLMSLGFMAAGFTPSYGFFGSEGPSATSILGHLVGGAIFFAIGTIASRVALEFVVAVFRIAENTENLRARD